MQVDWLCLSFALRNLDLFNWFSWLMCIYSISSFKTYIPFKVRKGTSTSSSPRSHAYRSLILWVQLCCQKFQANIIHNAEYIAQMTVECQLAAKILDYVGTLVKVNSISCRFYKLQLDVHMHISLCKKKSRFLVLNTTPSGLRPTR